MRPSTTIAPTALGGKGLLFFVVVVVLFLATPYSNLFFLLTAFLAVLGCVGVLAGLGNLRGLGVGVRALGPSPQETGHDVALRIDAPRRPRFDIAAMLEVRGGRLLPAGALAVADGDVALTGRTPGLPRGVHDVVAVRLSSRHPFGVVRVTRRLPVPAVQLVSYPQPTPLSSRDAATAAFGDGDAPQALRGDDTVSGLRPWRQGDPLRDVHWKASARRHEPVVKERDEDHGPGLEVVLDRRSAPEAFEQALSLVTALLLRAAEEKDTFQLRSQSHEAVYGPGQRPFADGLRWLASAAALPADAPPPATGSPAALRLPRARDRVARASEPGRTETLDV